MTLREAITFYRVPLPLRVYWWAAQWAPIEWLGHRLCRWTNPGCNQCWRVRMGILKWGAR